MQEFNPLEIQIENYRNQVKNLKELYELMNDEIEILNTIIEISISNNEEYEKLRNQAILLIAQRKEEE